MFKVCVDDATITSIQMAHRHRVSRVSFDFVKPVLGHVPLSLLFSEMPFDRHLLYVVAAVMLCSRV